MQVNKEAEAAGGSGFANARNAASGGLRLLDPAECRRRRLSFVAYAALAPAEQAAAAAAANSPVAAPLRARHWDTLKWLEVREGCVCVCRYQPKLNQTQCIRARRRAWPMLDNGVARDHSPEWGLGCRAEFIVQGMIKSQARVADVQSERPVVQYWPISARARLCSCAPCPIPANSPYAGRRLCGQH